MNWDQVIKETIANDFKAGLPIRSRTRRVTKASRMEKAFWGGRVKAIEGDKREFLGYASTPIMDWDREVIRWNAWDTNEYMKNPTLLLAHDYSSLPIGKCLWIEPTRLGLEFKGKLASPGVSEAADSAWQLIKEGMLCSFSVGFQPEEYEDNVHAKSGEPLRTYTRCKLLEISLVALPSNPGAVITSIEKAFKHDRELIEIDDGVGADIMAEQIIKIPRMMDEHLKTLSSGIIKDVTEHLSLTLRRKLGRAY